MIPGEYRIQSGNIALNVGRETRSVIVENHGDRPIQVGSCASSPARSGK